MENVLHEYHKAASEGKIGTQLIFSDIGTPIRIWAAEMVGKSWHEMGVFDVYNYIKTELVKAGIPTEEIAFIHDRKRMRSVIPCFGRCGQAQRKSCSAPRINAASG